MSKKIIHAVHDQQLKTLLESLGILEDFENGNIKCSICGCTVNESNFGCIYSEENEIKFSCNNLECYQIILKKRGGLI